MWRCDRPRPTSGSACPSRSSARPPRPRSCGSTRSPTATSTRSSSEALADWRPSRIEDWAESDSPDARRLLVRAQNLGVLRWDVWSAGEPGSILEECVDPNVRCLVVDLGSLGTREEQALVAEAVLARLWERRTDRAPVLIVIDEAHNVCPQESEDPPDRARD